MGSWEEAGKELYIKGSPWIIYLRPLVTIPSYFPYFSSYITLNSPTTPVAAPRSAFHKGSRWTNGRKSTSWTKFHVSSNFDCSIQHSNRSSVSQSRNLPLFSLPPEFWKTERPNEREPRVVCAAAAAAAAPPTAPRLRFPRRQRAKLQRPPAHPHATAISTAPTNQPTSRLPDGRTDAPHFGGSHPNRLPPTDPRRTGRPARYAARQTSSSSSGSQLAPN